LRGELALSAVEQRGYELFREYGCMSCHQGINLGGNMFQRFGVMRDYFADRGALTLADLGLFGATGREEDRFVFRVPSLRNVALTAPYFHDGSSATLEHAVVTMAKYQLDRDLDGEQTDEIAAFLRTLTGELGGKPL
jgi:cytochrome c peroxidase